MDEAVLDSLKLIIASNGNNGILHTIVTFFISGGLVALTGWIITIVRAKKEMKGQDIVNASNKNADKRSSFDTLVGKYAELEEKIQSKLDKAEAKLDKVIAEYEIEKEKRIKLEDERVDLNSEIKKLRNDIIVLVSYTKHLNAYWEETLRLIKTAIPESSSILDDAQGKAPQWPTLLNKYE